MLDRLFTVGNIISTAAAAADATTAAQFLVSLVRVSSYSSVSHLLPLLERIHTHTLTPTHRHSKGAQKRGKHAANGLSRFELTQRKTLAVEFLQQIESVRAGNIFVRVRTANDDDDDDDDDGCHHSFISLPAPAAPSTSHLVACPSPLRWNAPAHTHTHTPTMAAMGYRCHWCSVGQRAAGSCTRARSLV